jgi:hypothetical protein
MSRANAESSQLGRSQRVLWVGDGQEDRDVGELLEWLVPLAVNNLLVVPHNLKARSITSRRRSVHRHVAKIPQSIFKMSELGPGAERAPPLWVVREGVVEEPA